MIFYDFKMIAEEENRVTYETNNIAKQILFAGFRFKPKKQTFPFFYNRHWPQENKKNDVGI
jgi:hypothetical protein